MLPRELAQKHHADEKQVGIAAFATACPANLSGMSRSPIKRIAPPDIHQTSGIPRGRINMRAMLTATISGRTTCAISIGIITTFSGSCWVLEPSSCGNFLANDRARAIVVRFAAFLQRHAANAERHANPIRPPSRSSQIGCQKRTQTSLHIGKKEVRRFQSTDALLFRSWDRGVGCHSRFRSAAKQRAPNPSSRWVLGCG